MASVLSELYYEQIDDNEILVFMRQSQKKITLAKRLNSRNFPVVLLTFLFMEIACRISLAIVMPQNQTSRGHVTNRFERGISSQ